jgi:hypothetical protein
VEGPPGALTGGNKFCADAKPLPGYVVELTRHSTYSHGGVLLRSLSIV